MKRAAVLIGAGMMVSALVAPTVAFAQELYINGTAAIGTNNPVVGSVCSLVSGGELPAIQALLASPLPALADAPAIISAGSLGAVLAGIAGENLAVVGGPLVYLPASVSDPKLVHFYSELMRYLGRLPLGATLEIDVPGGGAPVLQDDKGHIEFALPQGTESVPTLIANRVLEYRTSEGDPFRLLPIRITARVITPIAVRRIPFGGTFTRQDVTYRATDATDIHGMPGELRGDNFQARTDIAQGDVIYADAYRNVNAVSAGKQIDLVFRRGAVQVTVPGTARQAGNPGDTIRVSPLAGGSIFEGTIADSSEVLVHD